MIELRRLTKRFGNAVAVDRISLKVEREETMVVFGASGCGKTTVLRLVAGFERPDAGEIALDGCVVSQPGRMVPPNRRHVGMVFQDLALWPHMRVRDNIEFALKPLRLTRAQRNDRVNRMLERVSLDRRGNCYPAQLSGGERQRVALARTIVLEPQIMLMDEPLASLDSVLKEELGTMIRQLCKQMSMTIIYVTHDRGEVMMMADRVAMMSHGRIEQVGSAQEILADARK